MGKKLITNHKCSFPTFFLFVLWVALLGINMRLLAQEGKPVIEKANAAFFYGDFAVAIGLYESKLNEVSKDEGLLSKLAYSCMSNNDFTKAAHYYSTLVGMPKCEPIEWLFFGEILRNLSNYREAKKAFLKYGELTGNNVKNKLDGCDSAVYWLAHPTGYTVQNFRAINTTKSDWGTTLFANGSLVFVSDSLRYDPVNFIKKLFNPSIYGRTNHNFQKIYLCNPLQGNRVKSPPQNFSSVLNGFAYHTGPVVFNAFFDTAYFTITQDGKMEKEPKVYVGPHQPILKGTRRLSLYLSAKDVVGNWAAPVPFAYNSPGAYSIGHAALSPDGNILYFTSDMPGGIGGLDIWYSTREQDTLWSQPKNCGPIINTPEDEAFPSFDKDGNLYFASKGHVGMGGYDIFKSYGEMERWTFPENLAYPINSPGDDFSFTPVDATSGYLSSNRLGGLGDDDIYTYRFGEGKQQRRRGSLLILETTVAEKNTKLPIAGASVNISDNVRNNAFSQIANTDGKAYSLVEDTHNYNIYASAKGFAKSKNNLIIISSPNEDTIKLLILLNKDRSPSTISLSDSDAVQNLKVGDKIEIRNLYYDFDKWNIRPDAAKVLDTLVMIMNQYPQMVIELSSHTDSRGTNAYNLTLSDKRAKSAVEYLIYNGIEKVRMVARGYGENMLINDCKDGVYCTEPEHQLNRRTEVRILKI